MSLDDALRLAETRAPELQAREAGLDAARSAAIAADRLPDPKLNLAIQDFPVTGPDAGRFNRDDFTMQVIGVSQDFPNPAKRRARATRAQADIGIARSEEHTSELQSLMRISYAVFCLKKTNTKKNNNIYKSNINTTEY